MSLWKRIFGTASDAITTAPTPQSEKEISPGGIKVLCRTAGIGLNELYRAMSGNTLSKVADGAIRIHVPSWLIYYQQAGTLYVANLGDLPATEEGGTLRTGTVINPDTGKPWFGTSRLDASTSAEISRNGPIGPFKLDFPEVVEQMESRGYQLMQNWFRGSAMYLLQKIKVDGKLKVTWKLALSRKDGGVDGLSFVDANTCELYVICFDQSKQKFQIEPNP